LEEEGKFKSAKRLLQGLLFSKVALIGKGFFEADEKELPLLHEAFLLLKPAVD
jgi:hypothetical protein